MNAETGVILISFQNLRLTWVLNSFIERCKKCFQKDADRDYGLKRKVRP